MSNRIAILLAALFVLISAGIASAVVCRTNYEFQGRGYDYYYSFYGSSGMGQDYWGPLVIGTDDPDPSHYTDWIVYKSGGEGDVTDTLHWEIEPAADNPISHYAGMTPAGNLSPGPNGHCQYRLKFWSDMTFSGNVYWHVAFNYTGPGEPHDVGWQAYKGGMIAEANWDDPVGENQWFGGPVYGPTGTPPTNASHPSPADKAENVVPDTNLSWMPGNFAASHDIYLGTSFADVNEATSVSPEYRANQPADANTFDTGLLDFGKTYYWRIDEVNDANSESPWKGKVWSFTTKNGKPSNPAPPDGAGNVLIDMLSLTWAPGLESATHDVYFGTDSGAVSSAVKSSPEYKGNATTASFDPGALAKAASYYWRIDEVVGGITVKGDVWSFTTSTGSGYVPAGNVTCLGWNYWNQLWVDRPALVDGTGLSGTTRGADLIHAGSGSAEFCYVDGPWLNSIPVMFEFDKVYDLSTVWIWNAVGNSPAALRRFGVYYSIDAPTKLPPNTQDDMTFLGEFTLSVPGEATTLGEVAFDFEGTAAKYVLFEAVQNNGLNGCITLGEVQFDYIYEPALASTPSPTRGAAGVDPSAVLSWSPGESAASHNVYLGTEKSAVDNADTNSLEFRTNLPLGGESYDPPGDLEPGVTYYWRIDEVNESDPNSPWKGFTWSFTVAPAPDRPLVLIDCQDIVSTGHGFSEDPDREFTNCGAGSVNNINGPTPGNEAVWKFDLGEVYELGPTKVHNGPGDGIRKMNVFYSVDAVEWVRWGVFDFGELTQLQLYDGPDFSGVLARHIKFSVFQNQGKNGETQIRGVHFYRVYDPAIAQDPRPRNGAVDVQLSPTLSWGNGQFVASHEVYFGPDRHAVYNATTASSQFHRRQTSNSFVVPEELEMGRTYYWRVDEVNESEPDSPWKGMIWKFTVDNGKARSPSPRNNAAAPLDMVLSWQAGPLAETHDVYFGTDEQAVTDAVHGSDQYKGSQSPTSYDPGALAEASTYYWRIDEVRPEATVKGDKWKFVTVGVELIKVDLALPLSGQSGKLPEEVIYHEATGKEGWSIWASPRWYDMYSHDTTATGNIGGTGVDAKLGPVYEGQGALHVKGLCMSSKAGGGSPNGSVEGEPIANSWFDNADWASAEGNHWGDLLLGLYNLPPGQYVIESYHNHWTFCSGGNRECVSACDPGQPAMPSITAVSLQEMFNLYSGTDNFAGVVWGGTSSRCTLPKGLACDIGLGGSEGDCGGMVTMISGAYNVLASHTLYDDEVTTSQVEFETDGSPVIIIYQAPDYYDNRDYPGGRGVLNAFKVKVGGLDNYAGGPTPCDGAGEIETDISLAWSPGSTAAWHEVYFGTSATAVANATDPALPPGRGKIYENNFDPGQLMLNTTYYWRVDEAGPAGKYAGPVWSFTTRACILVEDFRPPWLQDNINKGYYQGFGGAEALVSFVCTCAGSPYTVSSTMPSECGGEPIYPQCLLHHTDTNKALVIEYYHRSGWPSYSEVARIFPKPTDWDISGVSLLSMYFRGAASNGADRLYLTLEDSEGNRVEMEYPGSTEDLKSEQWLPLSFELSQISGVDLTCISSFSVGVGDRSGSPSGSIGYLYVDNIALCRGRCDPAHGPAADITGDCIVNFEDHAVRAQAWTGTPAAWQSYAELAEEWLSEKLVWP